jgi:hypothetical protein
MAFTPMWEKNGVSGFPYYPDPKNIMPKSKKHLSSSKQKTAPPKKRDHALILRHLIATGLIAGVALIAYSNTFSANFHFDDLPNIINNPSVQIKVFTWDHLERLIQNTYKANSIRFFSYFTLALNYYFGELNVWGYHLVNFLIHVLSGIFLYWFLLLTLNLPSLKEKYGSISFKVALFTSLIFISHPNPIGDLHHPENDQHGGDVLPPYFCPLCQGEVNPREGPILLLWGGRPELSAGGLFQRDCCHPPFLCRPL